MHNGILLTDIKFSFGYDCVGWEVLKWQIVLSVLRQCLIVNSLYSRTSIKEHSWDSQIMFSLDKMFFYGGSTAVHKFH